MAIAGLELLNGVRDERVLVLGFDLANSPVATRLLAERPRFSKLSIEGRLRQPHQAALAMRRMSFSALVLTDPAPKLGMLALTAGVRSCFVADEHHLRREDALDLALKRAPKLRHRWHELGRMAATWPLPPPTGPGNDYAWIAREVDALPEDPARWARRTASVMVPVYNRREVLARTLAGLVGQTYPSSLFEVIVADDGSHDRPESLLDEFPELDLRVVRQEDDGYRLAEVRNLAIGAAKGDVVVSLDCDMLPEPGFLAAHLRWFHGPDVPLCVIGYRRFIDGEGLTPARIREDFDAVRRAPATPAPDAIRLVDEPTRDWREPVIERTSMLREHAAPYLMASGGNVAFRKEDAAAIGGYHDGFKRWGGEDADFGYRLERAGAYFVPEPSALAYHQDHPSAVVREEDRHVTAVMVGRRIPSQRHLAGDEPAEMPAVSVVVLDGPGADRTTASVAEQIGVDHEVLPASDPRDGIRDARGETIVLLHAGERLRHDALVSLSSALRADSGLAAALGGGRGARWIFDVNSPLRPMMFRARDYARTREVAPGPAYELELLFALAERGGIAVVRGDLFEGDHVAHPDAERRAILARQIEREDVPAALVRARRLVGR